MANAVNVVIWLLILIFLSFWVAGICFFPYVIVSILTTCIPDLKAIGDILLQGINFPAMCAENMLGAKGL